MTKASAAQRLVQISIALIKNALGGRGLEFKLTGKLTFRACFSFGVPSLCSDFRQLFPQSGHFYMQFFSGALDFGE